MNAFPYKIYHFSLVCSPADGHLFGFGQALGYYVIYKSCSEYVHHLLQIEVYIPMFKFLGVESLGHMVRGYLTF